MLKMHRNLWWMNKESPKKREKDNAENGTIDKIVVKRVATFMCHER